jgi:hypothetical protein
MPMQKALVVNPAVIKPTPYTILASDSEHGGAYVTTGVYTRHTVLTQKMFLQRQLGEQENYLL